ncbi:MAG: hypothetical protein IPI51_22925 [Betaproteobacteria bacterium]|nr:hypothetical protein [Betaproteobacteria bacterium]
MHHVHVARTHAFLDDLGLQHERRLLQRVHVEQLLPAASATAQEDGLAGQRGAGHHVIELADLGMFVDLLVAAAGLLVDAEIRAVEGLDGGEFQLAVAVDVERGNVADGPVHELPHLPGGTGLLRRRDLERTLLAGHEAGDAAIAFEPAEAVVLRQAVLQHRHLQGARAGVFADEDLARVRPVLARVLGGGQRAADEIQPVARGHEVEAVDVGQVQHVGDGVTAVGQRLDVHELGFLPLEHLEELVHGQEFTVAAGDRHHRHGAARTGPHLVRRAVIRPRPGQARPFAFGGQQDAGLTVDLDVRRRITPVHRGEKALFYVHDRITGSR